MSYTIIYDRVGIKLDNNEVLLLFCYGASNCTMIDKNTGREVYERIWEPFSATNPIMTVKGYMKFIDNFCQMHWENDEYTGYFKSHNTNKSISVSELRANMANSVKRAKVTVEEFVNKGNCLYIAYNKHDCKSVWIAENITLKNIYTEKELREYIGICKKHNYPFLISMKNYKRKC